MARDSLGRFTARSASRRIPGIGGLRTSRLGRLFRGPVEGTEVDGVVSGPTVTLGGLPAAPATPSKTTAKSASGS